jgi:hypothetical protein
VDVLVAVLISPIAGTPPGMKSLYPIRNIRVRSKIPPMPAKKYIKRLSITTGFLAGLAGLAGIFSFGWLTFSDRYRACCGVITEVLITLLASLI